jgi:hypothetical protein
LKSYHESPSSCLSGGRAIFHFALGFFVSLF